MGKGIGGHQRAYEGATDEWLTPPELLRILGDFDVDPCVPDKMPWRTAVLMISRSEDGLSQPWAGRVFLNPPYGPQTGTWLKRLADHANGIALVFARTETAMFHAQVWRRASALLFLEGRLHFHYATGERAANNAGGPSVLVAYGEGNANLLASLSPKLGAF